jgi:hypothetical protein
MDFTLARWYGRYFRRRIESGKVASVCLVRSGHLGDVVLTEPVARFLSAYVPRIRLATDVSCAADILNVYDALIPYHQYIALRDPGDLPIRLAYELSDNSKSYIQGYMESIGYGDVALSTAPAIKRGWGKLETGSYALIAPRTSDWEAKKRNWGHGSFLELARQLETGGFAAFSWRRGIPFSK